jgi:hypothetical protein
MSFEKKHGNCKRLKKQQFLSMHDEEKSMKKSTLLLNNQLIEKLLSPISILYKEYGSFIRDPDDIVKLKRYITLSEMVDAHLMLISVELKKLFKKSKFYANTSMDFIFDWYFYFTHSIDSYFKTCELKEAAEAYEKILIRSLKQQKQTAKLMESLNTNPSGNIVSRFASVIAEHSNVLGIKHYLAKRKCKQALKSCSDALDWSKAISKEVHDAFVAKHPIQVSISNYKSPFEVNYQFLIQKIQRDLNFILVHSYFTQGYQMIALEFLTKLLEQEWIVTEHIVELSCIFIDQYLVIDKFEHLRFQYIQKLINYISRHNINDLTDDAKERTLSLMTHYRQVELPQLRDKLIFNLNEAIKKWQSTVYKCELSKECTTLTISWSASEEFSNSDFEPLEAIIPDYMLFTKDGITTISVANPLLLPSSKIEDFLKTFNRIVEDKIAYNKFLDLSKQLKALNLFLPKELAKQEVVKLQDKSELEHDYSESVVLPKNPAKKKNGKKNVKTQTNDENRNITNNNNNSDMPPARTPQTSPKVVMAKQIGFKSKDKEDVKIYPLHGEVIADGIFFAHGIELDKKDAHKIPKVELNHYQMLLEAGTVVPRFAQGLRIVRKEESGLDHITFKITDPNHNLRLMMELEEEMTDEQGCKKYLYKAGKAKYHK